MFVDDALRFVEVTKRRRNSSPAPSPDGVSAQLRGASTTSWAAWAWGGRRQRPHGQQGECRRNEGKEPERARRREAAEAAQPAPPTRSGARSGAVARPVPSGYPQGADTGPPACPPPACPEPIPNAHHAPRLTPDNGSYRASKIPDLFLDPEASP